MMSFLFPTLNAALAVIIPNNCDMVPPVKIYSTSMPGATVPCWEVSSSTTTSYAIQNNTKPLLSNGQWSPIVLAHTVSNPPLGSNWSSLVLNRTQVPTS